MKLPGLHVVATDAVAARPEFVSQARDLLTILGADLALHLRLREMEAGEQHSLTADFSRIARDSGGWCVVNGRVDVALTAGAQAVQLGFGALDVRAARAVLGATVSIGVSVHSGLEAAERAAEGADYVVAGTVFPTVTHAGPANGTDVIRDCLGAGLPVVGIGGIDESNASRVAGAGACGVAVIRAVWSSTDPVQAAQRLVRLVNAARTNEAER